MLGYLFSVLGSSGGPVSLARARRRGFWVGWESRERYPEDAAPRTRREVNRLLALDDARLLALDARDGLDEDDSGGGVQ